MIESGYVMPNWPKPWGRDAGAVEQLVIEQEFSAARVKRSSYGITSWVILTLIQYATPEQVSRWVVPALNQEVIWCQLFTEPGAGPDARRGRSQDQGDQDQRRLADQWPEGLDERRSREPVRPGNCSDQPRRA